METQSYPPPVQPLLTLGEPADDEPIDYLAMGLSLDVAPDLIRMACDEQLHTAAQDHPTVWAPVHAWRALGQLRCEAAIAPLVELFRRADDGDDWVSDDLPESLAQIGAAALGPVGDFLNNSNHGDWARVAAATTITSVAQRQVEWRTEGITRLSAQLDRFAEQSELFNAMIIGQLWDLRAVEALPVIERAFASGRVDESVIGDLEDVLIHFGLKTQREQPRKPNSLTLLRDQLQSSPDLWEDDFLPPAAAYPIDDYDLIPPPIPLPYLAPPKIGRNDPCPCGSGKKYKKCCLP